MRRFFLLAGLAWALPARARQAATPALLDGAARSLAALINDARQRTIADGVGPVPTQTYRSLLGYFPSTLLQHCRFAVGAFRPLTVPELALSYGGPAAVTLGEVVLFKTEQAAEMDLKLWAHQLTHVMQCQRWGIDDFADRYVRDSGPIKQEAAENANRFTAWLTQRDVSATSH